MNYKNTTQVPNVIFDEHLPNLSNAELKVLLVIVRQTNGWVNKRTGKRKKQDRITHRQFMWKTGLCRRVITDTIQSLVAKDLIEVSSPNGKILSKPEERKGRMVLLYAIKMNFKQTEKPKKVSMRPLHTFLLHRYTPSA